MSFEKRCKHYTGAMNKTCDKGVVYPIPIPKQCTMGEVGECSCFQRYTQEEIDQHNKEVAHTIDCMKRNVSSCCEAPIDNSNTIKEGRHKGHGIYVCSKCRKTVYMV